MENKIKDYILKQYESIGCLQEQLRYIAFEKNDMCSHKDYMRLYISSQFSYREDWLRTNGLEMTLDEYKLWESIRKQYEPEPSGLLG